MPRIALLLVVALVAGMAAGRTTAEFSSTTGNSGNVFSAAATFASAGVAGALAKWSADATDYEQVVLADNPFAYWRLGEAAGAASAVDERGARHATFNTTTAPHLGVLGATNDANTGMRWTSSGAAATAPSDTTLRLNDAFTIEFWVKATGSSTTWTNLVSLEEHYGWSVMYSQNSEIMFNRGGTPLVVTPKTVTADDYHHVVVTYDGTTLLVYGDSVLLVSFVTTLADVASTGPLEFVAGPLPAGQIVHLDEPALYDTALGAARVSAHYRAGRQLVADPCEAFRVHATITGGGVTSVTANLSSITPGATAVPMTAGTYTAGSSSFNYRSGPLRAAVQPGSYNYSVTWVDAGGTHTQSDLVAVVGLAAPVVPTWLTGFEAGVVSTPALFSSNAGGAAGTVARTGAGSLVIAKTSNTAVYTGKAGFTTTTALAFAVRFGSLPTADVTSVAYFNNSATPLHLGYQASGSKLTLRWGADAPAVATSSMAAGSWYALDLRVDVRANPNTASWRIDGVDQPGVSLAASAQTVTDFRFGSAVAADRFTADFDDVVHSPSALDYPLGPASVHALRPNGIGTHASSGNFQNEDGSAINALVYQRLDDPTMTSIADGVRQTTTSSAAILEIALGDSAHQCIRGVQGTVAHHKTTTSANNMRTNVRVASTAPDRLIYAGDATGNGVLAYGTASVAHPFSPGWWRPSDIDGMKFRIGQSADASPAPYWDALLLEYYTMT